MKIYYQRVLCNLKSCWFSCCLFCFRHLFESCFLNDGSGQIAEAKNIEKQAMDSESPLKWAPKIASFMIIYNSTFSIAGIQWMNVPSSWCQERRVPMASQKKLENPTKIMTHICTEKFLIRLRKLALNICGCVVWLSLSQELGNACTSSQGLSWHGDSRYARSISQQRLAEWSYQHGSHRLHLHILLPHSGQVAVHVM